MTRLNEFFHGEDTQLGVFYPSHHILAAFPNLADADHARESLRNSGIAPNDVIAVSGGEVVDFAEEHWLRDGAWGVLLSSLSRMIGTEVLYADTDLAAAKKGAAFVAVHCPTEKEKDDAWGVLLPTHPLVARYYSWNGIEHLTGEN
jgi:hypothetical protein